MVNLKSDQVEIKHLLRADSYNEEYKIIHSDSESENVRIINGNNEFFEHILLKYDEQPHNQCYIQLLGTNQNILSGDIKEWINKKIYNTINDTFIYVEGYAGCGKTTWVQSILYDYQKTYRYNESNFDIADIERKKFEKDYINFYSSFTPGSSYSSDVIRFSIINSTVMHMVDSLREKSGLKVLDNFCELTECSEINNLNSRLPNINKFFRKEYFHISTWRNTLFYKYAKSLNNNEKGVSDFIDICRANFNQIDSKKNYNFSMMDILCIDCLWRIAQSQVEENKANVKTILVCYDNLDVIEDLEALSSFVSDLENLKTNVNEFREKYTGSQSIPFFVIFATCRKITGSKLKTYGSSFLSENISSVSNEAAERISLRNSIIKVDVSRLYDYGCMVKKRASYFLNNVEKLVDTKDVNPLKNKLKKVIHLPKDTFDEINYTGLWNHNHRACNNVLSSIITFYPKLYNALVVKYNVKINDSTIITPSASILLHSIFRILNSTERWNKSMGYSDKKITTLSRLILTYLNNKRNKNENIISIVDIIDEFKLVDFNVYDENDISSIDNIDDNIVYICNCIQNLLNRLPHEYEEMWRRPLYYKNNALLCKNNEIHSELIKQYNSNSLNPTSFVVSDEGCTFIEKIVPQFEFYSARLNKNSVPLFTINSVNLLRDSIGVVFNKVSECSGNQIIFMNRYNQKYKILNITEYLKKDFHPTTVNGDKQLHIIRVIFSHVQFLNGFRDYLYYTKDSRFKEFNIIIIQFIYKYLELYSDKFYDIMENTIGKYNNDVWNELAISYNKVVSSIVTDESDQYVASIKRSAENQETECINKIVLEKYKEKSVNVAL